MASLVTRHTEPEILQGRLASKNFCEARVERHALLFQCDGRIENFTRRRHRGWMIPAEFAGGKARRPDRVFRDRASDSILRNCYFASSVARVSRMTVTRICPGYVISVSILRATSRASIEVSSSEICDGSTITRISRPACTAKHFSTPLNDFAIVSRSSRRLT